MKIFTKKDTYVYTWESEPFVFQKGCIYVIEVDLSQITRDEVSELAQFFKDEGVQVRLVSSKNGKALNPIRVERKKELD